jgi:hypothetical protein
MKSSTNTFKTPDVHFMLESSQYHEFRTTRGRSYTVGSAAAPRGSPPVESAAVRDGSGTSGSRIMDG